MKIPIEWQFHTIALNYEFERFYRIENLWFYRSFDKTDVILIHSLDSGIAYFLRPFNNNFSGNELYQVKSDNDSVKSIHHIFKNEGFFPKTRSEAALQKIKSDVLLSMLLNTTK
jgi:hypothetical protein